MYNTGSISGYENIGGIAGWIGTVAGVSGNNYLYNAFNSNRNIEGEAYIGQLSGEVYDVTCKYGYILSEEEYFGSESNSSWTSGTNGKLH